LLSSKHPPDLLPGTLELILRTIQRGAAHGYSIAEHIRTQSSDVLEVAASLP
jgi:hypothetical protein